MPLRSAQDEEDPWANVEINSERAGREPLLHNPVDDPIVPRSVHHEEGYALLWKRLTYACVLCDVLFGTVGWLSVPVFCQFVPASKLLDTSLFLPTLVVLSTLWLIRAVMAVTGMVLDHCNRCGLKWSSYSSVPMGVLQAIAAVVLILERDSVAQWITAHSDVLYWMHVQWLVIGLAITCGYELVRYQALSRYRVVLLRHDARELLRVSPELLHADPRLPPTGRRRPWWWSHESTHGGHERREPLLADGLDWATEGEPVYTPRATPPPRRFFAALRGQRAGRDADPRDEGSVDFESVQEEWASRDEQDPHWWSREEEGIATPNTKDLANEPPSWIHASKMEESSSSTPAASPKRSSSSS